MRVNFTKLLKQSNQTLKHLSYNKQIKLRKKKQMKVQLRKTWIPTFSPTFAVSTGRKIATVAAMNATLAKTQSARVGLVRSKIWKGKIRVIFENTIYLVREIILCS